MTKHRSFWLDRLQISLGRTAAVFVFSLCLAIGGLSHGAFAADSVSEQGIATPTAGDETAFQFYDLAERKATLVVKIGTLRREITQLEQEKIPAAEEEEKNEAETKERIEELQKEEVDLNRKLEALGPASGRPPTGPEVERRAAEYERLSKNLSKVRVELEIRGRRTASGSASTSLKTLREQLDKKRIDLDVAEKDLNSVQRAILKIITPEQSFKRQISLYSAILIGIVICGFFAIAGIDFRVRRSVFAGQAGIQFLALFSIVIAIILFGITGILGGNELAALLGSISGYILGKVSAPDGKTGAADMEKAMADPPLDLNAEAMQPGQLAVSCRPVSGASNYIWFAKRAGEKAFKRIKTTSDSQAVLEGLNPGEVIEVRVAAANSGGESPTSQTITATAG